LKVGVFFLYSLTYKTLNNTDLAMACWSVVGWPWLDARCPQKQLYHSTSSMEQGRENI